MSGTFSYHRQDAGHRCGRYYATDSRRRHRHSSFSIMRWFRRSRNYDEDDNADVDSAWFRDDLRRIQQAYVEQQEPDYAAVTPIAARRKPAATSWSRWSGSTTTVYSFAYVDGGGGGRRDDDVVEYIDAATLPLARRRPDRGQCAPSTPATATTLNRTGTMTATKRRNKRVAPPPPPALPAAAVAGPSSSAETAKTATQRRTATVARKKYRAPQPPGSQVAVAVQSPRPQSQHASGRHRRNKGPAPKPPVQQQQTSVAEPDISLNVRRKITLYERDLQRLDKIEKHFFDKSVKTKSNGRVEKEKPTMTTTTMNNNSRQGFASVAALYTAMAATNLTELDKRAAEICRRKRLEADTIAAAVSRPPAIITDDHKNAIVAAVIRKSYPTTVSTAATADGSRSGAVWPSPSPRPPPPPSVTAAAANVVATVDKPVETDNETQLVRHKRLAFFQQRDTVFDIRRSDNSGTKCSSGTQTIGTRRSVPADAPSKTLDKSTTATVVEKGGECSAAEFKHFPSEDNNCYQRLLAMEMKSDLVLHNGPFECTVCLCTYDNNGVVLRDCLHVFCRPCLQMTIGHSNAEQVECPYIDDQYSCPAVLQHREIKKILDSDEEYERFLQRSVERARQLLAKDRDGGSFQCRLPDCTGWCLIYDKNNVFEFKCPVCGTVTCVRCGSIHAPGKGCQISGDINDGSIVDTLENLIDRGDAMPCPGCNTILSKQQGCDWIKCAVCFMEICWATKGPRWGPKGKGDTTAGCMCGIPVGRKCHTDCKYCH